MHIHVTSIIFIDTEQCHHKDPLGYHPFMATASSLLPCLPLATINLSSVSIILSFQEFYVKEIILYGTSSDCLFSFSITLFRSIEIVACIIISFLLLLSTMSWYEYTSLLTIHPLKDIWVVWSFLAIINKAAVNSCV